MKTAFHLALLFGLLAGAARGLAANNGETAFDAANKLYAQGKFTEAAAAYQQLIEAGTVSAALYFNLGNAQFKSSRIGRAVAAYQQAAALSPRDPDIRANLQFARNQVPGPTVRAGVLPRALGKLSLNEWTVLGAITLWATFVLLGLRQFKPALQPVLRTWVWLAAGGTCLFAVVIAVAFTTNPARHLVIVTANDTAVRSSPFDESPSVFAVNDGAELRVTDHKNGWLQVTDDARRFGWLKRDAVVSP